jgi:hypothetical protein
VKKLVLGACLSALGLACSPNHNEAERWEEAALQPPPIGALSCAEYAIHKDKFEWVSGIWDFEGTARATYTYTDRTAEIYVSNDAEEYGPGSYAAPTLTDPTVCHDDGGQGVLRLIGDAPFLNWGGGAGRRLQDEFRPGSCGAFPAEGDDPLCPDLNPLIEPETGVSPNWSQTYYQAIMDLREYDGVSFWARRGERGQPGIRINLADIYVDDDISFIMSGYEVAPYCQRAVSCDCSGARRCVQMGSLAYCMTPEEESGEVPVERLDLCGQPKCAAESETFMGQVDPAFGYAPTPERENRQCQPYYFKSDVQSVYNTPDTKFCYDAENGPFPAENFEKCGDNWMASVHLTTEWKFYRVPFTDFQQQGWAMKSPRLDVANLTMLRFTWGAGRVDHYFDEVRFYRGKR